MEIIDKKEETFDLVLTEKGREKLSKGRFIPHSYSFYDNEIIYENNYNGINEEQNDIQPRIKKDLILGEKVTSDDTIIGSSGKKDVLKYPTYFDLGGYKFIKPYKPAWKIYVKEGEIKGTIKQFPLELEKTGKVTTLDSYKHDKIPQLNVFCEYKIYKVEDGDKIKFYVARTSNDIAVEILEENSFDDKENFIVETFQYKSDYTNLKKLVFVNKEDPITQDNVEHFFNIFLDDEKEIMIDYSDELDKIQEALPKDPKDC